MFPNFQTLVIFFFVALVVCYWLINLVLNLFKGLGRHSILVISIIVVLVIAAFSHVVKFA